MFLPFNFQHKRKVLFIFLIIASLVLLFFEPVLATLSPQLPASTSEPAVTAAAEKNEILQFTAAGSVVAFSQESATVASARYMARAEFVNSHSVTPRADEVSKVDDKALPLNKVYYNNLWDGVDLTYEADKDAIVKSTYYLADGSVAKNIRLNYNRPLQLDNQGNLLIKFDSGTMVDSTPIAWQEIDGKKHPIAASYVIYGESLLGFQLENYLPDLPVIIDPWLTFLGTSDDDSSNGITVDSASGDVYVTGMSNDTWGSPVRAFNEGIGRDGFVAKLNSSGALTWNTFLGGIGHDAGNDITLGSGGDVYVAGISNATWGSPVRAYTSTGNDGFVAKLNSSGALTWNTFLGGSGYDYSSDVALGSGGDVYVAGTSNDTWGSPVRAYTSGDDGFVAKLNSSGALTWNTFLGGNSPMETVYGIAVNPTSDDVHVSGASDATWGSPVRAYTSGDDGFVAKLNSSGALTWNTFLGSSSSDFSKDIAVNSTSGDVYVTGISYATWGSPVRAYTSGQDGFVAKLNSSGALTWNTFLGDTGDDSGVGIALGSGGDVHIAGISNATWGSPVRAYTLGRDGFVAKLNSSGALTWNTFLGGSGSSDSSEDIAVDSSGDVYVAGVSNATWGSPVRAYTSTGNDGFVAKLNSNGDLDATTYTVSYNGNNNTSGTAPDSQIKTHGVNLALRSNTGSLARTGYTFSGWNTAADGSGTSYAEGGTFTTDANTTLYAKWTLDGTTSSSDSGQPPVAQKQAPEFLPAFTKNLKFGSKNKQVKALQQFLNRNGFKLAKSGAGSVGKETNFFGRLTRLALRRFQKANNIHPAIGYFGPITRKFININQW